MRILPGHLSRNLARLPTGETTAQPWSTANRKPVGFVWDNDMLRPNQRASFPMGFTLPVEATSDIVLPSEYEKKVYA